MADELSLDGISIDLSQTQTLFPEGVYKLYVTDVVRRPSPKSEYDYLLWTLKIAEGPHEGGRVTDMMSLSPNAAFRVKRFLQALGFSIDPGAKTFTFQPQEVLGRTVMAHLAPHEYDGEMTSRVSKYLSPRDLSADPEPAARRRR